MCLEGTAFPLADANGNAVTYLDDAGNVQAHYVYNAFGGSATTTDFLGRTKKTERSGFGGTTLVSETFYNTDGTVAYTAGIGVVY